MRRVTLVACCVLVSGCLVPTEPAKQAEEISSISAEGALLAHEVGDGDVTDTFTRVHSVALREKLSELEPEVEVDALAQLLHAADAELARLGDESVSARSVELRLDRISKRADELAK